MEGQMSIFDYPEFLPKENSIYTEVVAGTENIINYGKPDHMICRFSEHTCNKEELWKVAKSLDMDCPEKCCRQCNQEMCGARCNGSKEPIKPTAAIDSQEETHKCIECRKFKIDCLQEHPIEKACKDFKASAFFCSIERCQNCKRWTCLPKAEQPPAGWGIRGFCHEHNQRTGDTGYCMNFEMEE